MRPPDKKRMIMDFLKHMQEKDIHLAEIGRFDKETSIWSKRSPQASQRTMIEVNLQLDRLSETDQDIEVDKFLMMSK